MEIESVFTPQQQQEESEWMETENFLKNKRPFTDDEADETIEFEFFEDFVIDPESWEATEKIEEMGYMYTHIDTERPIVIVKTAFKSHENENETLYGFTIFFQFNEDIPLDRVGSFYIPKNKGIASLIDTDKCKIGTEHSLLQIANRYKKEGTPVLEDFDKYYTDFFEIIKMSKLRDKEIRKRVIAKRQQQQQINS